VRRFLLFREGEPYDPALLEQTERNLRALSFLRSARVSAGEPHDGVVDVEVVTQDAWTTELETHLGRGGGETTWAAGITESNALGLGKEIGFLYDEDVHRTNRLFEFHDPALFGPYWSAGALVSDNSDGSRRGARVAHRFSSPLDRTFFEAFWDRDQLQDRLYADGEVVSRYVHRHEAVRVEWGTPFVAEPRSAQRVFVGFDARNDTFRALGRRPTDLLPAARDFRYLFVGYENVANDFVSASYVNRDQRIEDFNLGRRIFAEVGLSPALFGASSTTWRLRSGLEGGWRLGALSFVRAAGAFQTRLQGGVRNAIFSGTLLLVWKHPGRLLQTTVARLQVDRGWNLDRDVQFFADGDNGLRGYRLYAFEGNRRVVVNVEHRLFGGFEVLQLFSLGAAAFVDAGAAEPANAALRFSSFKRDAGVGLRIGIARAALNSVLRVDCAYAFDRDPLGRRGWLVSFSSGQAF